jgi:hypothetical protein
MSFGSYLWTALTIGVEYRLNVAWRFASFFLGFGRFGNLKNDAGQLYQLVMNTSLACYINKAGHAEFHDFGLPYRGGMRTFARIALELDHSRARVVRMAVQEEKDQAPITTQDADEIAAICVQLATIGTHIHVHWWANGVADLLPDWPLAQESSDITQWMNHQATESAPPLIGITQATLLDIFNQNIQLGFPIHAHVSELASRSTFHAMASKARSRLGALLPDLPRLKLEALLAGTLIHSADHFYLDRFLGSRAYSKILDHEATVTRLSLVGINAYHTRRILCRQRLDDPICRVLYETALEHDPDFANEGLFFTCAS